MHDYRTAAGSGIVCIEPYAAKISRIGLKKGGASNRSFLIGTI